MNDKCWKCETNEDVIKVRSIEFQQGDYAEMVPACMDCASPCDWCDEAFFISEMTRLRDGSGMLCRPCELQSWIDEGAGADIRSELDTWTVREAANVA